LFGITAQKQKIKLTSYEQGKGVDEFDRDLSHNPPTCHECHFSERIGQLTLSSGCIICCAAVEVSSGGDAHKSDDEHYAAEMAGQDGVDEQHMNLERTEEMSNGIEDEQASERET
tara:strand:- start:155 stop:499 length:345 start_codon:yes stop_codon:yes gene_type:complete